jgi:CubicO group peptidase (beta-lactamase class C family)
MRKKTLPFLFFLLWLPFLFSACTVGRILWHNIPGLNDYKHFPTHKAEKSTASYSFLKSEKNVAPDSIFTRPNKGRTFEQFLKNTNTVAFLVIRRDTILYENYLKGYSESSLVPSYSMAKSVTSILIGCAIDEGLIGSIDEPIRQYLPEMRAKDFDGVTIKDVLQMTTGLKFSEGYANPFGSVARLYYGTNMRKFIRKARRQKKASDNPNFAYKSGNSQILGALLERAIKKKYPEMSITDYLAMKLWQPLGMEFAATWSLDSKKQGMEKTFCCLNACARDYAKIGQLYLNKGKWADSQIVPAEWVAQSTRVDERDGSAWFYQYQWWLPTKEGDFYARGVLGQYIYVNPAKQLVIVRLGKGLGGISWGGFFAQLAKSY